MVTERQNDQEYRQLEQAIAALEARRDVLGDEVVEAALSPMRKRLSELTVTGTKSTLALEGERKLVTVMFADITGFTPLSERLDPETVRELVNACFDNLVPVIENYGGTVEKFIGDEIYAIFGAPVAHENDPERAVQTALEMMDALLDFNDTYHTNLGMHIGINTGLVIAGGIGSEEKQQYGVMGDTVNLGSRLADAAEQGEIFVGPDTYHLTTSLFDYEQLDPMQVKGKSEPIHPYKVIKAKPRAFRLGRRGIQGVEIRMVGRDVELVALQGWLNSAFTNRQTTLVTVLGDAGVGKSRLLNELENWLLQRQERVNLLKGRGNQQHQGVANRLLRDLFAYHIGISESDPIDIVRSKLETGIAEVLPDGGETKAHFLGAWLGYDYSHSPYVAALGTDAEQLHNRASLYLGQFFSAQTDISPVVIMLDDLQWVDSGSMNAIVGLCRRRSKLPLFIICLARWDLLDRRPEWGSNLLGTHYEQLDLLPLTEVDARVLVAEILQKVTQIPPLLEELLIGRAEGNPYYMEELVKMLIDQGVIYPADDRWQIALDRLTALQVPDTLTEVLQARLDRLSPMQKQALQQAAVVGRIFWDAVLAELGAGADARLIELTRREFVQPQRQSAFVGTVEYIFKHALLRDVTYETVLIRVRRTYHRLVGDWLAAVAETNRRTDEYAAIIGNHYDAAGAHEIAAKWYGFAGKQAARQFDHEAAVNWLSRALDLTPEKEKVMRYELLMERESVYHLGGKRDKQVADLSMLEELVGLNRETDDSHPEWCTRVLIRKATYARAVSDYPAAITAATGALDQAKAIGDGRLAAAALACMGDALWRQGAYASAQARFSDGVLQATSAQAQEDLADNLKGLGIVAYEQGDYGGARKYYDDALEIYRGISDRQGESACLGNLGLVAADQGNFVEARGYHQSSLEIVREIGYRRGEGIRLNNLGVVARDQGNYVAAQKYHQEALEIYREIGYRRGESICLLNLGVVARNQGNDAGARDYYHEALKIAREVGYRSGEGLVLHDLGALSRAEGDLAGAKTYLGQALDLHEALCQPQHVVEDQAVLAGVAMDHEDLKTAWEILAPVLEYLTEHPTIEGAMHPYRVPLICGQVLRKRGEIAQACQIVQAAIQAWATLAGKLPDPTEQKQFGQIPEYVALRDLWAELGNTPD